MFLYQYENLIYSIKNCGIFLIPFPFPCVFHILSRAEELETALMEMVKEDNRLELTARVCATFEKLVLLFYIISLLVFLFLMIRIRPNSTPRAGLRGEGYFFCQSRISTPSPPPDEIQDGKSSMHTIKCGWSNNNTPFTSRTRNVECGLMEMA